LILGATATVLACGDESAGPTAAPGDLAVQLGSPNGPEGALLVEFDGPVSASNPAAGQLHEIRDGDVTRILVLLEAEGVIGFQLAVPDTNSPPEYRIIEVSGPDNSIRNDLAGYSLEFSS